ncbi:TATA-binding protein-like factor [Trypanosoma grayi]|uniref:TATA-binding protein-like factor n=1 Tax=Trypanosoma grayi TaxID=71804 RepID=UPI0004F42207|nr:TATA-binding protein-like factor [Trypanosoma grayi]KEG09504.1 TATA-binding protein-like factor [Trypanosoma grayi]
MDDDFDDFGGDFDLDENDFFKDGEEGAGEMEYAMFAAGDAVPRSGGPGHLAEAGSATADGNGENKNSNPNEEELTPPNIQELFPNAALDTKPVIVGIIAQAKLGEGVDLRALSCATRNVEFIPRCRTPAATMRLHDPSAVVLVRTSGFMSIIGAASVSEARQATELAARIIRKALGLSFCTVQFRVRSVMARFNLGHPIRLDELAQHEGVFCSYEPDRFSGCIVRLAGKSHDNRWQVSCTVFVTGKVSMVGARSQEELRDAFYTLLPILARYAKK